MIRLINLRVAGTIATIDINYYEQAGYLNNVGRKIGHHAIARGVLLRLLGNVLYLMPPDCMTASELVGVYGQIDRVLGEVFDR